MPSVWPKERLSNISSCPERQWAILRGGELPILGANRGRRNSKVKSSALAADRPDFDLQLGSFMTLTL